MSDALADRRKIRVLTVLDTFTRECVALEVGGSFGGAEVARVLTRAGAQRGLPAAIHSTTERSSRRRCSTTGRTRTRCAWTSVGRASRRTMRSSKASMPRSGESAYRNTTFRLSSTPAWCSMRGGRSTTTDGPAGVWGRGLQPSIVPKSKVPRCPGRLAESSNWNSHAGGVDGHRDPRHSDPVVAPLWRGTMASCWG